VKVAAKVLVAACFSTTSKSTWVQEMWNQVLQEVQAMEGTEQPTWLEQPPHGLFLVLNRGGSGTSKSIPLRLWYIFIFTNLDFSQS